MQISGKNKRACMLIRYLRVRDFKLKVKDNLITFWHNYLS